MFSLLLVDDEEVILDGLFANIDWEGAGFQNVYKAGNAETALNILSRYRIDIVIADIVMPGMDGLSMCGAIRKAWPLCRVIFLTGYQYFEYARRAIDLGAYKYMIKPVCYEEIQAAAEDALSDLKTELRNMELIEDAKLGFASSHPAGDPVGVAPGDPALAESRRHTEIIASIKQLINEKMSEGITVNEIAEIMHYNPSYLSQLVRRETGQALCDLLISMRMETACRLLASGEKVQSVAQRVGYDNLAHFSRIFKKRLGLNPRSYR